MFLPANAPPETWTLVATPFGGCGLAWNVAGLTRLYLPDTDDRRTARRLAERGGARLAGAAPADIAGLSDRVARYFAGEAVDFADIVLDDGHLGPFEAAVYAALRRVDRGKVTTYGTLAREVGAPEAARAVGAAMGRNPWPLVVPCHRVLAASARPGGFSAPGGTASKLRMLRLEGVRLAEETPVLPGLFG